MSARERQFEVKEVYGSTSTPVGSHWFDTKVNLVADAGKIVFIVKKDNVSQDPE